VEYLIRQARITDIERLSALCVEMGVAPGLDSSIDATGLLRQLVYIPNASVLIAEARRQMAGGAVLALRPSIEAGGFVGTVDVLVVARGYDTEEVADALIVEMLRSARNKGCATVEVMLTKDAALRACWQRHGFAEAATYIYRVAVVDRDPAAR
jgi:N-acetylglutamate synthase-like GNAT family acetyltransferase